MEFEIPTVSHQAFNLRLQAQRDRRRLPLSGSLELTFRCNFECVHCYEQGSRDQPELSGDRWCELIDEMSSQGCLYLTLTGGEAILHPGFEQIYEHAIRRGMLVTVFSNGSLLTERIARLFQGLPPRSIEVTLYGFSAETYAKSTARAKGFEQAVAGVRRVVAAGHKVQLKTVVFDYTAPDFQAMKAFAAELGVEFRYDTNIHAAIGGNQDPLSHRLPPEEIIALERADASGFDGIRAQWGTPRAAGTDQVYRCGAGRFAFNIAPDGFMQLCTIVRSLRFDLSRTSFSDAWQAMATEVARRYESETRRCSKCELRFMCGTCPGIAELETGDVEAAIDHICETTHLRATEIFGRPFIPRWKQAGAAAPAKLRVLPTQGDSHARRMRRGAPEGAPAVRRPYLPPHIERVVVMPDEAVLAVGCKATLGASGSMSICGNTTGCSGVGS